MTPNDFDRIAAIYDDYDRRMQTLHNAYVERERVNYFVLGVLCTLLAAVVVTLVVATIIAIRQ